MVWPFDFGLLVTTSPAYSQGSELKHYVCQFVTHIDV